MLVPSKFTRLEESTIFKMKCILDNKEKDDSVMDVYIRNKDCFFDASEFLHALDVLYVLGLIEINEETGFIIYA